MFDLIHWDSVGIGRKKLLPIKLMQTCKIMHDWLPTGYMRKRIKEATHCPGCRKKDKTLRHVLQCLMPQMEETRKMAMKTMRKIGQKKMILRHIFEAFWHVIQREMDGREDYTWETYDTKLRETIVAQQKIGVPIMLMGFLAKRWLETMEETGTTSTCRKMNALQELIWTEIIDPIW